MENHGGPFFQKLQHLSLQWQLFISDVVMTSVTDAGTEVIKE